MQTKNKNYFSMGAGQSQSEQCSCSKPGTISLTGLQLFSMVIPLCSTSILTAQSRNSFPFFQCIIQWGISIYTTLCTWLDQWIWSFGQISEDGLFQFYTRSCKGIVHYILFDQGQRTWSGAVPFRKRLCNVAGRKRKSYIEHLGKSEVEVYQRVVCLQHILSTTNTSVRLQKKVVFTGIYS